MNEVIGFEKMRIYATIVKESGKEKNYSLTVDWQGNTPLEAINSVLKEFSSPRGPRVKSIDRIEGNVTPPLSEDEIGEREVIFENTGVFLHHIKLGINQ